MSMYSWMSKAVLLCGSLSLYSWADVGSEPSVQAWPPDQEFPGAMMLVGVRLRVVQTG